MKNKFFFVLLLLNVFFLYANDLDEDALLDDFFQELNLDEGFESVEDDITIEDIQIKITGSTRESWVKSKLIVACKQYKAANIQKIIDIQKNYFESTKLFYSTNIYITPGSKPDSYILNVELTDGFFQMYNFYPWDLMWGIRHLLHGNEELDITLGYNTQSFDWVQPNVMDSLFSYSVSAGHYYGDIFFDDKCNMAYLKTKVYITPSIFLDTGFEGEYAYTSMDEMTNNMIKYGYFINLFPSFEIFRPVGFNVNCSIGGISDIKKSTGMYFNVRERLLLKPLEHFSVEVFSDIQYTADINSITLMPDTRAFRSPVEIERNNIFNRNYLQINFERILGFPLGFTRLYINPFVFMENAIAERSFRDFDVSKYYCTTGGAVAFEFGMPVNLYFAFGVKQLVYPYAKTGFMFNVLYSLY